MVAQMKLISRWGGGGGGGERTTWQSLLVKQEFVMYVQQNHLLRSILNQRRVQSQNFTADPVRLTGCSKHTRSLAYEGAVFIRSSINLA